MSGRLNDVLPSVAALIGCPGGEDRLGLQSRLGDVRRVAVVLVDGMGYHLLAAMAPYAPLLAQLLTPGSSDTLTELSSPFPSTTPTSLVTLGTGLDPGEHGVLGFTVNVPGTERVLTHIFWRDDPDPRVWQPTETWFERLAASGFGASVVLPQMFQGSGLTDAAYRGARFCGLAKGEDAAGLLLSELATGPGLVLGYIASLDAAAHLHGVDSPQWRDAAAKVERYLSRIVDGLPSDAALVVTADHGGLNAEGTDRLDLDTDPRLSAGVRIVAGEPRVRYLHTTPGATDDVLAAWRSVLGERADVLSRDEAVGRGLFGAVSPQHLDRIGDVVAICQGTTVVLATAHEPPEVAKLVGFHGAMTPVETAIPLITLRR